MNKAQLVNKISEKTNTTKCHSELMLDAALCVIQSALAQGNDVKLVGFGTFSCLNKKSRIGRNPKTGVEVKIPATCVPRFRPGKDFKVLIENRFMETTKFSTKALNN